MTTNTNGTGSETAAGESAATPSSGGGAAAAAPAAGATPDASAAGNAGAASSAASAAGEGADKGKGGFLDDDGAGTGTGAPEIDAARMEAFSKAEGADARKEAFEKLNDAEKAKAAEGMSEEDRKALGIEAEKGDGEAPAYTEFKMPEGMQVDAPTLDKAKGLFAKHGLSQEVAQEFVDLYAGEVGEKLKAATQAPYDLWRDTQQEWIDAVHSDAELGGDKHQAARANAARFIDTMCKTPEERKALRAALTFTGATNNPEIFRAFSRAGASISEGRFVAGQGATPAPKAPHEVMYGQNGTMTKAVE